MLTRLLLKMRQKRPKNGPKPKEILPQTASFPGKLPAALGAPPAALITSDKRGIVKTNAVAHHHDHSLTAAVIRPELLLSPQTPIIDVAATYPPSVPATGCGRLFALEWRSGGLTADVYLGAVTVSPALPVLLEAQFAALAHRYTLRTR
jgi:hypothetical protein